MPTPKEPLSWKAEGIGAYDVAQASEYYYWEGTLTENQIFSTPWQDAQGKARLAYSVWNQGAATAGYYLKLSHSPTGSPNIIRHGSSTGLSANGGAHADLVLSARYWQFQFLSGSTAGSYPYKIWIAVHPVS
jgi:hypothetical protein